MNTISRADLKDFIASDDCLNIVQNRQWKYKSKWEKWATNKEEINLNTNISWNWAAFFFQEMWLLYRKMMPQFWVFLGIRVLITVCALFLYSFDNIVDKVALVMPFVIGILGNTWYLKKCLLINQEAQAQFNNADLNVSVNEQKRDFFRRSGGTRLMPVLLYLLLWAMFTTGMGYLIIDEVTTTLNSVESIEPIEPTEPTGTSL